MPRNSNPEREKKKKKRGPIKVRENDKRGGRRKPCIFCKEKIDHIDYKDVDILRRFVSDRGKIRARRVSGNCIQHQRAISVAIKTSRELALMPYALRLVTARAGKLSRNDEEDNGDDFEVAPRAPRAPRQSADTADAAVSEVVVVEETSELVETGEGAAE